MKYQPAIYEQMVPIVLGRNKAEAYEDQFGMKHPAFVIEDKKLIYVYDFEMNFSYYDKRDLPTYFAIDEGWNLYSGSDQSLGTIWTSDDEKIWYEWQESFPYPVITASKEKFVWNP